MQIYPAIDILNGKVVRLREGNYSDKKEYSITPIEAAKLFYDKGAKYLHVVDLDGAKSGKADNAEIISKIVQTYNMSVEVGGGIRNIEQIKKYVDCGVEKVIIGTKAVESIEFVKESVNKFNKKIAIGVDAKDGKVAVSGWQKITEIDSIDFCNQLERVGVNSIIYTDISKDGMLNGTNLEIYRVLCQTLSLNITASGGISSIEELKVLKNLGVSAAILGKSLYECVIDLEEAIKVAN